MKKLIAKIIVYPFLILGTIFLFMVLGFVFAIEWLWNNAVQDDAN